MTRFDHAVITVGARMDAAVELFVRLGFKLTERGWHTLGSINHLIVLGSTYIELLGLPADRPDARPELRDAPQGLNALVFGSDDADATLAQASARGARLGPVQQFSRPVRCGGVERDAVFRTVRAPVDASPAGRLYFCQHLTPELVWQASSQDHANGAIELTGASLAVRDLAAEAKLYRALLGQEAVMVAPEQLRVSAPPVLIEVSRSNAAPAMQGLSLAIADLDRTGRALTAGGVAFERGSDEIRVDPASAWNVALRFVRQPS
jgi:catechol 2,3-dioxygenase-like lactoylglutathione lyase family enzyme